MKTYKIVYTIANKPRRHVTFYEAACEDFSRIRARDELGGWDIVTIWEGTLYLSVIRDLYDNSIVAYKTGTEQNINLVLSTIRAAKRKEKVTAEL